MRYALRTLAKTPGFTCIAILTLTLGIGANTAIFSIVNSVLLKPLNVKDPARVVAVWDTLRNGYQGSISYPDLQDMRAQNRSFERLEAYFPGSFNLRGADRPERVAGARVTAGWLGTFGVNPVQGRLFLDTEDHPGAAHVVVLREDFWRQNLGGEPGIVGKTVALDGEPYTVVGVMPADFHFPSVRSKMWVPLIPTEGQRNRGSHFLRGTGRLLPGVTIQQAQSDLSSIVKGIADRYPTDSGNRVGSQVFRLQDQIAGSSQKSLLITLGAVVFVFLIACANVANLLLVRASSRQKEISIRRALGAGSGQLFQQFAVESLVLSISGAVLGWLVSLWGVDALVTFDGSSIPRTNAITPDWRVLGFTVVISLVAAAIFASASAFQSTSSGVNEGLKDGGRTSPSGSRNRLRSLLVVGEIATALILLVGAGLLIESFWRLQHVDPGFRADHVLTARIDLPAAKYRSTGPVTAFWDPLMSKLAATPGVVSAGAIDYLPIETWGINGDFQIEGRPDWPVGQSPAVELRVVGADYFAALKVPLVAGRFLSASDTRQSQPVVIINQAMAKQFWPGQNPVGSRLRFYSPEWMTIAGVAGDVRQSGTDSAARPELFVSYNQLPPDQAPLGLTLVIRSAGDALSLSNSVRAQVQTLDSDQPVSDVQTMEDVIDTYLGSRRFTMILLAAFAAVAMLLASLGIYGVMAWTVRQRTQEIGIRLALGATISHIFRMVMTQGIQLVLIGLGIGIAGGLALTRVLASLLFEVKATDVMTFAAVSAFLAAVALLAIFLPARRATRVDPMVALRYE